MVASDARPFGQGPALHLDQLLAWRRLDRPSTIRRAAGAFLISFPPLVVAGWEGLAGADLERSLLGDFLERRGG
jgi:hypothetical protein